MSYLPINFFVIRVIQPMQPSAKIVHTAGGTTLQFGHNAGIWGQLDRNALGIHIEPVFHGIFKSEYYY